MPTATVTLEQELATRRDRARRQLEGWIAGIAVLGGLGALLLLESGRLTGQRVAELMPWVPTAVMIWYGCILIALRSS